MGLISGVGFNFHYLFLPYAIGIFIYIVIKGKEKPKSLALFLAGALVGNFTMVAFDLRHDFYHVRTLLEYTKDVLSGIGEKNASYFYILNLWPLFALSGGLFLKSFWRKRKVLIIAILIAYLYLNLNSNLVNFSKPTGMPEGILYKDIVSASEIIARDATYGSFNVTSLLDFDKRGFVLRYPLEFLYGSYSMGVEEYPVSDKLYVLSQKNYNFSESEIWEVSVFKPFEVTSLGPVGQGYQISRLDRQN